MSRQSTRLEVARRGSPGVKRLGVAVWLGVILSSAPAPAQAGWGVPHLWRRKVVQPTPPDQSWLKDLPEASGAHSKGKIAVFVFEGDDVYQPVRAAVVRTLRRRGLNVTVTLRPVDSAAQFRELSSALNLAAYVEGEVSGEGARQSAHIRLRSGANGQRIASATFSGPTQKIVADVGRGLWTRVGGAVTRARSSVSRPRQREREPMRIDAGTPLENTPTISEGT